MLTEEHILKVLHLIEIGNITIEAQDNPEKVYCGYIEYLASNRWKILIFDNCDSFDNIELITLPDGEEIAIWNNENRNRFHKLKAYKPSEFVASEIYGICKFERK